MNEKFIAGLVIQEFEKLDSHDRRKQASSDPEEW
jgi:hypothetical protein